MGRNVLFCALVAVFVLYLGQVSGLEKVSDIKFLQVIFRHGYRATAYKYKTDPYGEKIWPGGFSSLTNKGVKQHFELGKYLGRRYEGYVDADRAVRDVYVRSTNYDRTIQSAMANMAGWFPPVKNQIWDKGCLAEKWRPFPVRLSDDPSLLGETDCESIDSRPYRADLQEIFDYLEKTHKKFLDMVRQKSGEAEMTIAKGLEQVSDVLRTQKYEGVKLPSWATADWSEGTPDGSTTSVYDQIQYLDNLRFHIWVGGNGDLERARVNGGRLLGFFLNNFNDKINNKSSEAAKRKVFAYASHDNSIGGLLSVLDLYDYALTGPVDHIPLYANTLFFELHNDNTVRILHKNDTTEPDFTETDPIVLKHPKCSEFCPLEKLIKLTAEYVPADWKSECDVISTKFKVKRPVKISGASDSKKSKGNGGKGRHGQH